MNDKNLIREYVKQVLKEDDVGDYMGAAYDISPYGVHFASSDQLYNTFIKPFTDVVGVAAGKTKELSQKTQTLVSTVFKSVATALLPFLSENYKETFASEKKAIDKIKSEYNEVYSATWDAFKDKDAAFLAFMYSPALVLGTKIARAAPAATANMLSVVSGGELDDFLDQVKDKFALATSAQPKQKTNSMAGVDTWYESIIREDSEKPSAADVLTSKKVIAKAINSPVCQRMQADASKIVRSTLASIFKQAQAVCTAKSIQDLQQKLGKKIKGAENINSVPQQERQAFERDLLESTKKSMKEFYVKSLEAQVNDVISAGIPENSRYVSDYRSVISKIKSL